MTDYDVLRVFCGPRGEYGDEVGVVRNGSVLPEDGERQALAAKLGFGRTVFVDDPERGVIDIRTPAGRPTFTGTPCVGAAWLLDVPELTTDAGVMGARQDGEFCWIEARAEWAPRYTLRQYASAAEVDGLAVPSIGADEPPLYAWAWEDEPGGRVRARAFTHRDEGPGPDPAARLGDPEGAADAVDPEGAEDAGDTGGAPTAVEEEATGAAAMLLTERLGRALNITQGTGSQLLTAPQPHGWTEVGGRVLLER
ncbi:PhzF family phenazine biosynthesis protein [Streptomyces sp. NPDC014603]|uniref:PhzF family phenazine biosynthesis protein n=1 Tax=unclassified Streptomyces TaxID=2593676 RepID=UPI003624BC63